jgi:hypothetical protein
MPLTDDLLPYLSKHPNLILICLVLSSISNPIQLEAAHATIVFRTQLAKAWTDLLVSCRTAHPPMRRRSLALDLCLQLRNFASQLLNLLALAL